MPKIQNCIVQAILVFFIFFEKIHEAAIAAFWYYQAGVLTAFRCYVSIQQIGGNRAGCVHYGSPTGPSKVRRHVA